MRTTKAQLIKGSAKELRIEIPAHPPKELSLNAGEYINPHKISRIKKEWQLNVAWLVKAALRGREWETLEQATVTFERVIDGVKTRPLDDDNFAGYFKATRDVLKPNGRTCPYGMNIIKNDDSAHLTAVYREVLDRARAPMTVITVKEKEG